MRFRAAVLVALSPRFWTWKVISAGCLALIIGWVAWNAFPVHPSGVEGASARQLKLDSPYGAVLVALAPHLSIAGRTGHLESSSVIRFALQYPSGQPLTVGPYYPGAIYLWVTTALPPARTWPEYLAEHALPQRPQPPGRRYWFESEDADGTKHYAEGATNDKTAQTIIFVAADGVPVAVELPVAPSTDNQAERRYSGVLGVRYLYPAHYPAKEVDSLVVRFLDENTAVKVVPR